MFAYVLASSSWSEGDRICFVRSTTAEAERGVMTIAATDTNLEPHVDDLSVHFIVELQIRGQKVGEINGDFVAGLQLIA